MQVVAGCVIEKDGKILMVKEAKESCYGQWNFPAGHVDEHEAIMDAAIREAFEETGCKVRLTGTLPISTVYLKNGESVILLKFVAEIINEEIKFDTSEILDVQWIDIDILRNMGEDELRGYDSAKQTLKDFEENNIYPLEIYDDGIYVRG